VWLINSGCTNHKTHDASIFKELDQSYFSKVTISNGESVDVKGKGVVAVETPLGTKYIADVLYVPKINQSLLSVGQMLEKHYALHFEDMRCTIFDPASCELMSVKMRDKSFSIEWKNTTMHALKPMVENEAACPIKKFKSDNGTEYIAREFEKYCEHARIQHQLTVPYTPQQNGVRERKNRIVMEMSRCLFSEKCLPKVFWDEAINTSIYLLNMLPTKALRGKTPFEAWYGSKHSVEHLRIFGYVCYALVPKVKRDKLDHKSEAKYILAAAAANHAIWLRKILFDVE